MLSYLLRRSDPNRYCDEALLQEDLSGRTVLVTGGGSGFGKLAATQLVAQGANVVIAVRRLADGEALAAELTSKGPGRCSARFVDLAVLASVRKFAEAFTAEFPTLHVLIENAAVCCVPCKPSGEHSIEPHLAVNHYGHFLLRQLLIPTLARSAPSRIVVIASALHDRLFDQRPTLLDLSADPRYLGWTTKETGMLDSWMAYARSKLANVMSATGQAPELAKQGIACVSVHPGLDTSTELFRAQRLGGWIMRNVPLNPLGVQSTWQSIQTALYCALAPHEQLVPGGYYSQYYKAAYRDGQTGGWPMTSPNPMVNAEDCDALVKLSHELVGREFPATAVGPDEDVAATPSTGMISAEGTKAVSTTD